MDEMIGRVDMLETKAAIKHWKADGLDLTALLTTAEKPHDKVDVHCTIDQDHGLEKALDNELIRLAKPALENGSRVLLNLPVRNTNLTVGGMLSHQVVKNHGEQGLPDDTIHVKLSGSAGQSCAAWLARGITVELEGDANDYVGKGLSGGKVIVYPPRTSSFAPEENVIVGNVVLYGATSGQAFFRGRGAERFCIRNSGVDAVIEGVGDHCCEYMTGGHAVILGTTGRNFAAGMSGGIAYVWDETGDFRRGGLCNLATVDLETMEAAEDIAVLHRLIELHQRHTGSNVADEILRDWDNILTQFVKVMPIDYKRVLTQGALREQSTRKTGDTSPRIIASANNPLSQYPEGQGQNKEPVSSTT